MIALAAALIGAGILASAALYNREDHQVPVLMVTAAVPAGSVITSADVGTTTVAAGPGPADDPGPAAVPGGRPGRGHHRCGRGRCWPRPS